MPTFRTTVEIASPFLGGTGVNTWHMRTAGGGLPDSGILTTLLGRLQTFYGDLIGYMAGGTVVTASGEFVEVGTDDPTFIDIEGWSDTQGSLLDPLPPATALCVTWRTNSATRSGRGRSFFSPLATTTLQDNGTPDETFRGALIDACANLVNAQSGPSDGAIGVYSQTQGLIRDITGYGVPNEFAVLRSRRD